MEFLYSLNRLNVATSRARCVAMVVRHPRSSASPARRPRQMRLANGLCLAVEAARDDEVRDTTHGPGPSLEAPPPLVLFPHLGDSGAAG